MRAYSESFVRVDDTPRSRVSFAFRDERICTTNVKAFLDSHIKHIIFSSLSNCMHAIYLLTSCHKGEANKKCLH